jgi:hypothetical protein
MTDTGEPFEDRPIFQKASTLIPMDQVKEHYNNLVCGNAKWKGCKIQKDWPNLYFCRVCMLLQAVGTAFFSDEKQLTEHMLYNMTEWQHKEYNDRLKYMTKWLDNYPRGATA